MCRALAGDAPARAVKRVSVFSVLEVVPETGRRIRPASSRPASGAGLSFPLTVVTDGAQLQPGQDGSLAVVAGGEVVATTPTPLMWDAVSDQGRAYPITKDRPAEDT